MLDVIIVNYRSPELTERCVKSIIDCNITTPERIVIVDNNSQDGSADLLNDTLPDAVLIEACKNAGFGAGVNLGARALDGEYCLVLNPDTYFTENVVERIIGEFEKDQSIAIVGLDLIGPDGRRQFSARRFYSLLDIAARRMGLLGKVLAERIDRHLMKDKWGAEKAFEADWVMGTGFVIRRSVFQKLGGMDEGYFLYMEDVDLCARAWRSGYHVVALPNCCLVHDHQRSSAKNPLGFTGRTHLASLMRFAAKFNIPFFTPPTVKAG
jgi:GT2 family glycosyltransferase